MNRIRFDNLIKKQIEIARKAKIVKCKEPVNYIAGVDVAGDDESLIGFIAILSFPEMEVLEVKYAIEKNTFPYIPNFLAFRELPVIIKTYKKLKIKPDLILVDGQGIAHPRSCGIATHLGVAINRPTIGCAKSHLFGDYSMPRKSRGSFSIIRWQNKKIGIVIRTRDNVKPLFVSPGNLVDLSDCRKYILKTTRYRIPEPIRYAHIAGKNFLKNTRLTVIRKEEKRLEEAV
uniref:Endonuclease V n=1 Tax=candidate division WOR-3 bacterium TaxID=2052148 RepID=A0A7C4TF86_UNCW3